MARLRRLGPAGIPQHIIQRGNNRQVCFGCDQDMAFYTASLAGYSVKFGVEIHAWVFMTNHVHLLVTPKFDDAVSRMMQAIGRHYVSYFNREYRRSGTLWEGRFKSSLVQSSMYVLQCQRYIELNPVRAGMVDDPANYVWSSYQCSALGKASKLFSPHGEYLGLGCDDEERFKNYRSLFLGQVDIQMLADIRNAVNKGLVLGDQRFTLELEELHQRRLRPARMGRPPIEKKVCSDPAYKRNGGPGRT